MSLFFFKKIDLPACVGYDFDAPLSDGAKKARAPIESILGTGDALHYFIWVCVQTLARKQRRKRRLFVVVGESNIDKGVLN
jgi:hypothetical protein